jgi:hypothetical protein
MSGAARKETPRARLREPGTRMTVDLTQTALYRLRSIGISDALP